MADSNLDVIQVLSLSIKTNALKIEDSEEAEMSTQFLRIQKNQLIALKQHLKRYVNTTHVIDFVVVDMI